ncbi:MAG: hypothetical protein IJS08_01495 [Victivallales bacterium]|nr:hypothetical protein [Victivallales bacterium]
MKKTLFYTILLALALPLAINGFEVNIKVGNTADTSSALTIGTEASSSDAWDEHDECLPPGGPMPGAMNYLYFRGAGKTQYTLESDTKDTLASFEKLGKDYKSQASSLTWVLVVGNTYYDSISISWNNPGLASSETLTLCDENGTTIANMANTTECSLAIGVYYIKYIKNNVHEAPCTPEAASIDFVPYTGNIVTYNTGVNTSSYIISDPQVLYFNENNKCIAAPEGAQAPVIDAGTNSISFTVPSECNNVNIYYTVRHKTDNNAGTAQGVIHLNSSPKSMLRLVSDNTARAQFSDESMTAYLPFTIAYKAEYPSELDIAPTHFSVFMPPMDSGEYSAGQFWSVSARVNGADAQVSTAQESAKGSQKQDRFDITYPDTSCNGYDIELTITPGREARSGSLTASINCETSTGTPAVQVKLPGDSAPVIKALSACEESYAEDKNGTAKVELSATFQDNTDSGDESGIKAIDLTATIDGNDIPIELCTWSVTDMPTTGAGEVTLSVSLTLSPELLNGAARNASGTVRIAANVMDGEDNEAIYELWSFELKDTDRAPAVTTAVTTPGTIYTHDTNGFTVQASNVDDPDGDEVRFLYEFYLDGTYVAGSVAEQGVPCTVPEAVSPVRGQTLSIRAFSVSYPAYLDELPSASSEEYYEKTVLVANTAPVLDSQVENQATFVEYSSNANDSSSQYGEKTHAYNVSQFAIFADIDIQYGSNDALSYSIVENNVPADVAEITCSGNEITFTLKEHQVLDDENATFKICATDEGELNGTDKKSVLSQPIRLRITPVNEKPSVAVADIYLNPLYFDGAEKTASWAARPGKSADESGQALVLSTSTPILNGELAEHITSLQLEISGGNVVAKYTLAQLDMDAIAALMDKEASFSFTVTDDGETPQTSKEYTVAFHIVSTPWYPTFAIDCTTHGRHQVVLSSGNSTVTIDNVIGNLMPADYYNSDCEGLPSGSTWSVAVHPIINDEVDATVNCVDENTQLAVEAYDVPERPSLAFEETSPGMFNLTIQAPMASKYQLFLYNVKYTLPDHVTQGTFAPNGSDFIPPSAKLEDSIRIAGTYFYKLVGINPEGESEEYTSEQFETEGYFTPMVWPEDGVFTPEAGETLASTNCTFRWPKISTAVRYVLHLVNIATWQNSQIETVENSLDIILAPNRYTWWVVAFDQEGNRLVSYNRTFDVANEMQIALIDGTNLTADGETISFNLLEVDDVNKLPTHAEVQLVHNNGDGTYTHYKYKGTSELPVQVSEDGLMASITLNGATIATGDLLSIRLKNATANGKYCYYNVK